MGDDSLLPVDENDIRELSSSIQKQSDLDLARIEMKCQRTRSGQTMIDYLFG
jgi:hypothetical protein